MTINKYEAMLQNQETIPYDQIGSLNRFYLANQNKRMCKECRTIIDDYKKHFHSTGSKRGESYGSNCAQCTNIINRARRTEYRKDYAMFIKSKVSAYKHRAKEIGVNFDLDAEYLIQLYELQKRKMLLHRC